MYSAKVVAGARPVSVRASYDDTTGLVYSGGLCLTVDEIEKWESLPIASRGYRGNGDVRISEARLNQLRRDLVKEGLI